MGMLSPLPTPTPPSPSLSLYNQFLLYIEPEENTAIAAAAATAAEEEEATEAMEEAGEETEAEEETEADFEADTKADEPTSTSTALSLSASNHTPNLNHTHTHTHIPSLPLLRLLQLSRHLSLSLAPPPPIPPPIPIPGARSILSPSAFAPIPTSDNMASGLPTPGLESILETPALLSMSSPRKQQQQKPQKVSAPCRKHAHDPGRSHLVSASTSTPPIPSPPVFSTAALPTCICASCTLSRMQDLQARAVRMKAFLRGRAASAVPRRSEGLQMGSGGVEGRRVAEGGGDAGREREREREMMSVR
ncbi:MAG: hypothetical protein Q9160_005902 [Pyrenula sp. 1 TL-2023]